MLHWRNFQFQLQTQWKYFLGFSLYSTVCNLAWVQKCFTSLENRIWSLTKKTYCKSRKRRISGKTQERKREKVRKENERTKKITPKSIEWSGSFLSLTHCLVHWSNETLLLLLPPPAPVEPSKSSSVCNWKIEQVQESNMYSSTFRRCRR